MWRAWHAGNEGEDRAQMMKPVITVARSWSQGELRERLQRRFGEYEDD